MRDNLKRELSRQILIAAGVINKSDPESSSSSDSDDPDVRFVGPGGRKSQGKVAAKRRGGGDAGSERDGAAGEGDGDSASSAAPPPAKRRADALSRDKGASPSKAAAGAGADKARPPPPSPSTKSPTAPPAPASGRTSPAAGGAGRASPKPASGPAPSVVPAPLVPLAPPFPRQGTIVALVPYPALGCRRLVLINSQRLRSVRNCPYEPWETKVRAFFRMLRSNYAAHHRQSKYFRRFDIAFSWSFRPEHAASFISRADENDGALPLRELVSRQSGLGLGEAVITTAILQRYRARPEVAQELAAADAVAAAEAAAPAPSPGGGDGGAAAAASASAAASAVTLGPPPFEDKAVMLFDWLFANGEDILDGSGPAAAARAEGNSAAGDAGSAGPGAEAAKYELVPALRLYYRMVERPTPLDASPQPAAKGAKYPSLSSKAAKPAAAGSR